MYRRRSNTHSIVKSVVYLDSTHVVPYNTRLLLKYQVHINVKWCNQNTSIKYLLKYTHKSYDKIIATIVPSNNSSLKDHTMIDGIKKYLNCRYVSLSKPC